jgi:predicted deacylase
MRPHRRTRTVRTVRTARRTRSSRLLRLGIVGVAAIGLVAAGTPTSSYAEAPAPRTVTSASMIASASNAPRTVLSQRTIGHSVRGHAIRAYEMGSRSAPRTAVFIGAMHGNETAGSVVISSLMSGKPIRGVHIWAIRRDNPDGVLAGTRSNARGVDLNRNFPTKWKRHSGSTSSGPRPRSEPETRALMRFLDRVDPDVVVTLHSPLHGIDTYGAKNPRLARRLAENMRLPIRVFDCGDGCHGTLTQWFNKNHRGACVTVEFGANPSSRYLHVGAPRGIVRGVFGRFLTR